MKNLINYLSKKSLSLGNGSGMHRLWTDNGPMKSRKLFALLFCLLFVGVGNVWGDPTVLFREDFGNNSSSARDWSNDYKAQSGVSAVYSGATSYTVTNAKQSKNTMGHGTNTSKGNTDGGSSIVSNQGSQGTVIIGPLNVASYESLALTHWFGKSSAAGDTWNESRASNPDVMKVSYSTNNSTWTVLTRTGSDPNGGAVGNQSTNHNYVQASYTLPVAAQVSTLYLKFEFYCYKLNKSSAQIGQVYIDEVVLTGTAAAASCTAPSATSNGSISSTGWTAGWTAPASAPGSGYVIVYKNANSAPGDAITESSHSGYQAETAGSAATSKTITLSGVSAGETCYWWIRSKCGTGNYSSWLAGTSFVVPQITAGSASGTSTYVAGSGPGSVQTFTVSGVGLTGNLTVTAPSNFQVSTDNGSTWSTSGGSKTITASGTLSSTTVKFRLASDLAQGSYGPSNIVVSGGGAASVNVSVSGTVSAPASTWKFKYSGDGYTAHTMTEATGIASYSLDLAADTRYEFGFDDNGSAFYKNQGTIITTTSGWVFNTSDNNCKIHTGPAGTYTFAINTTTKAVTVTYPTVSHPNDHYVYFKNTDSWGTVKGYLGNTGNDNKAAAWPGSDMQVTTEICGENYYYAALNAMSGTYNVIVFNNGSGSQTSDLSTTGSLGKFNANQDANWHDFKYSITFAGNGNTGGSMSPVSNICIGSNQTLASNGYTKTHYHFTGWIANVDVKIGGATVTEGTLITNAATIQDIHSNITLTAQWAPDEYTISTTLSHVTSSPAIPSSYTYTGSAAGLSYTISANAGYRLPTSITVSGTTYTWNSNTGVLTLTGTITSNVSITITAVQTHTVTWLSNGSNYVSPVTYDHGAALAFPASEPTAPSSCSEKVFVGWTSDSEITSETSTEPTLISEGGAVNADATYRAVFADEEGGGTKWVLTSLGAVTAGTYAILNQADQAFKGTITEGHGDCTSDAFSFTNGEATSAPTGMVEVTIEVQSSGFSMFNTVSEKYLYASKAGSGGLNQQTSKPSDYWYYDKTNWKYNHNYSGTYPVFRSYNSADKGLKIYGNNSGNGVIKLAKKTGGITHDNYITLCCSLKPVTGLNVSSMTANSVTLSWTAPSPTTGIDHLELRNASTDAKIGSNIAVGTTSATVSGLTECETYSYKVVSVGATCETPSEVVDAQPFSGAKTITYNYHEGTGSPASFTTSCGNTSTNLPTPTRENYRFDGWYTEASGGTRKGGGGDSYTPDATITLHAQWTRVYTVSYDYAGGGGSCAAGGPYAEGEMVTTCATATKAGSTLTGWRRSDNGATVTKGNSFTMGTSNVTLTAVWEDTEYTLTQNVGSHTTKGHTGTVITSGMTSPSGLDLTYTISDNSYALPKTITISGGGQTWTLGTNYTWELSADKHSATLHLGSNLTISANVIVTVTEQARYTVVWDEHGITTTEYYASDDSNVTMKGGIADCGEKKFYGWTEDAEFVSHATTPPTMASSGAISGNKHYYAIFADADEPANPGYVRITSGNDIESGIYMIASPSESLAYAGQNSSNSYAAVVKSITFADGAKTRIASLPSGAVNLTLTKISANKFTLKETTGGTPTEKYLKGNSSNEIVYVATSTSPSLDDNYYWQLADFTKNAVTTSGQINNVSQSGRFFRYNSTGSGRIAAYQTSATTSEVYLYKLETTTYSNYSKTCTLYDIAITTPSGGTVTTSPAAGTGVAGEGQTVTVNVTPNSCKYLSALKYNDGSDHAISIASTPYTFTMPASDVTVTATFADKSVSSIAANTDTHRTLMQGTAFEGEQIRVTYNNGETEDLAWNDASLTFSGYNMSTLGDQTVSVAYSGSCGSANTSYSIEITDGIPVTFSDCGITTVRKYEPGDVVPVETTSGAYACSGWEFVGWSETSVAANSTSFTPVRNFTASTSKTLYAVYAHQGDNFISAKLTSELHTGARYVLAYYVNNNNTSYGLTGLLPTAKNTNYLQGTHTGNSGIAFTETNVGGLYQYTLTSYTPVSGVLWQLQADGSGYWQLYNMAQRKYLNLSSYSDGYVSVSTTPVGKLVLEDEDANPAYCNGSRVYVKYNGGTKRLAWNRNSGDGYWNQHTSGYQFFLTKDEYFSSTPPCAPRSVTFHGNGGTVIAKTGTPTGADLEITEASRDAGIYLPTAETDAEDCDGKVWSFIGWIDHEVDLTRVPILTTDMLNDGYDPLDPNPHYDIIADDEEYWAVYTNTGDPETKHGTISFTKVDFDQQYSSDEKTITKTVSEVGDYTFGYKRVGHQSSIGIQFENGTGEFYNKTSLGKVTSISFTTFNVGAITNLKVYVGDEEKSTTNELTASDLQVVGSTYTYYPRQNCGYVYIKDYNAYVNIGTITVNFGQGTEVWATTPDCSILSLSGTVRVTSTNGKRVKAVTPITVSGHGLAANAAVSFAAYNVSDDTPNSHFTFIGSASADINGDVSSTNIVVAYQPTETSDGTEEVYFKASASNGSGTTESGKLTGYGRHLPAKFVIATKVSGNWYALPNNVTTASYGTRDLIPITVDNTTTPTTATVYTSTTDYLAWGMNAAGTSTDRYTTDGEKISFVSAINSKGLAGNASGLRNSAALPATTSDDYLLFDWTPATTDLVSYTLQNGSVTTYYVATNGSDQWNTATTGADVRFLIYDEQPAATITWYNDMLGENHTTNTAENGYVTLPTGTDPESCNEPSGLLTFDGWVTATWTGFKTTGFTKVVGGEVATSNTTYYAVFKTGDNKYYTKCPTIYSITYTPNGGTGSNYVTYTMNTTADAVTVETAGFEKSGSTFVGWTNPSDEDGTIITPGAGRITGLSGDITLNAVWIGTVSVTGTVRLTTAAGEKVATGATDVTISSTDLACATALRITYKDVTNDVTYGRSGTPSYTSSEFRLCDGSYGSADGSNISLAEVSGSYNQTFSITYEPNGGANTLDEYQLKVEVLLKNTVIDTKTLSLYGRTLPASFAIAIKVGGSWYALPNNMDSEGTYDPILISVTEDASVLNWTAQGPSTVAYKMKDYTPNYSKLRFAADDATEYCLWAATGNSASIRNWSPTSTASNYAWTVTPDANFNVYTMANLANTRTALKINDSKWEMYNTGGLSEIHFIPLTTVTPLAVTVMEWGVDEIAVKTVSNWTPSAITAQISGGSPSAVTKTSIGGDLYKLTGVGDLQGNPGEPLALNVTDGGAKQAIIQIPFIVTDTKTEADLATILKDAGYAATLTEARSLTKNMDVIVRRNGTLSSESSVSGTFQNVYIYPGGKADFTKNISIQNLYMRGGFSWLGGAYAHPQMNVASTASITGIGSTGHGIFYDLYLDNSIYYVFALPKDVSVTTITNEENGDDWDAWIKSYSGEGRTLSPKVSGWSYVTSGSIARGAGYEIAIKPRLNRPYGILRFPLLKSTAWSTETDCTPSVTGWGANNTKVSDNNKGWNFIGNPFLTAYNNTATPGSSPGGLIQTKTLVPTDTDPWDGKYAWSTSAVKYFTVPRYTEYEYDDVRAYPYKLDAFFPFFIQATGDGTVTFDDANKTLKAPVRNAGEPVREVFVDFQLSSSNGQSDVAGLTISNQYSDAFDMNDKEKTIQNGNSAMKVYTLVGKFRTAFNALTEATAALPIPVGVIAPAAGTYRFTKLEDADYTEVEHLWLTDYTQSSLVDLLVEPFYEFTTVAGRIEDRFAINATLRPKHETTTGTEQLNAESEPPMKFIWQDKMYILRGGVIYDATGKKVKEINK